jgi:hypothetical protein
VRDFRLPSRFGRLLGGVKVWLASTFLLVLAAIVAAGVTAAAIDQGFIR